MRRALKTLDTVEVVVLVAVLVFLVTCTFAGVVLRYVFNSPFTWMEEVQLASMVWLAFLGGSLAFRSHGHVAVEIVIDSLPTAAQRTARIAIGVIVYAILLYLFLRCMDFLQLFAMTGRGTPVLDMPYTIVYGIAPVAVVLMIISYTATEFWPALSEVFGRRNEKKEAGA
ncbi:TRAP transporter small permease [Microbacterium sp. AK031]|uniref:TRAP transporter small permease n=1 Tax=Microbacterium sp. AK031 TaxID=2723076 RepID=UPI002169D9F5|nr:TRAP transporter small permease [Microbacterium sp. AK031]MCS3844598.1 TRAP-type C4-dicarboxylate transport system permease small subunit [Microbacterium sp. AK031]